MFFTHHTLDILPLHDLAVTTIDPTPPLLSVHLTSSEIGLGKRNNHSPLLRSQQGHTSIIKGRGRWCIIICTPRLAHVLTTPTEACANSIPSRTEGKLTRRAPDNRGIIVPSQNSTQREDAITSSRTAAFSLDTAARRPGGICWTFRLCPRRSVLIDVRLFIHNTGPHRCRRRRCGDISACWADNS